MQCKRAARPGFERNVAYCVPLLARSASLAAIVLAAMFGWCVPIATAGQASAMLQVSAVVRATTKVQTEYQSTQLTITADDIQRGYVEVRDATRISVHTNSRNGYALSFYAVGELFQAVEIAGLRHHVGLGPDGGTAVERDPAGPNNSHDLSYRFVLRSDLQPGNYPWPLMLSVRPL